MSINLAKFLEVTNRLGSTMSCEWCHSYFVHKQSSVILVYFYEMNNISILKMKPND